MERTNSTTSNSGFWATIDLLIGRDWKDRSEDFTEDAEINQDIKTLLAAKLINKNKRNPGKDVPRDSLTGEELSWSSSRAVATSNSSTSTTSSLPDCNRITDKQFMSQLQQHIKQVQDLAMQQRIANREKDEMNRLKKLILQGKSPLKDCPPELQGHPVFTFWKLVNKEMDKISKAKFESFAKKQKRMHKSSKQSSAEGEESTSSMTSCSLGDEGQGQDTEAEPEMSSDEHRFTPREIGTLKYEDDSVKELRELQTVEELYQMADQIIGIPNNSDTFR